MLKCFSIVFYTLLVEKRRRGQTKSKIIFHIPIDHVMYGSFAGMCEIGDFVSLIARVFQKSFQDHKFFHNFIISAMIRGCGIWDMGNGPCPWVLVPDSFECIERYTIGVATIQKILQEIAFKFMPELFISQFTHLEFTEGDEIEIKDRMFFFVFYQFPQKFSYLSKIIRSSRHLQYFIVEALDTKAESHSWKIFIFLVYRIYKVQDFIHRIWIEFDTQFRNMFKIEFCLEVVDDIDNPVDADPARSSSSEIECFYFFIRKFFSIIINFFFQRSNIICNS